PPEVVLPKQQCLAPNFSLSHSREWVACVVSLEATLGVDIEVIDSSRDVVGISEIAFHPSEHTWLLSQPAAERVSAFYNLWSAKEAIYKLRCNLGGEPEVLSIIGDDSAATFLSEGLHQYDLTVANLSLVVFADRRLSNIHNIRLSPLSPADWFA
ncbi:MAG TPA: 4'-phosphopantetheinyl transferase superfamily protein, partial [Verrucomicrobiae bacterium]|nr:4'-phosphopantetheinyl transferase superfamily protein [Verrucomicrobiae bacterium]